MLYYFKDEQFVRMPHIEEKFGIKDFKMIAFTDGYSIKVIGEIFAEKIKENFTLQCSIFDQDGDVIGVINNDAYGKGMCTHVIHKGAFFDGYPFKFTNYFGSEVTIAKIRIIPIPER